MTPGTKAAITLSGGVVEHVTICRPLKRDAANIAKGYCFVRFNNGGAKLWVHASGLSAA